MRTLLIALIFTIGVFSFSNATDTSEKERKTYDFYWSSMPTVCALKSEITAWLDNNNFQPVSMGWGRENGRQEGQIVYAVVIYVNDNYEMAAIAETPDGGEACVVFRTFDMQLNHNLKPGSNL